ncbi:MAG: caspase family protein [Desulfomonilaceae bacterium]
MKPPVLDGSPCRTSYFRVAVIIVLLIFLSLTSFILSFSAEDQTSKAVRRTSSESGVSVKGQKRVALVIGNNEYKEAPLKNPAHDAEDIANVLRGLGFTVQTKINADQRGMEEAVKEFVREIQNGDVGLFYFSGHGVQVHGENYLMPAGGSITSEAEVKYKAVNAGLILAQMDESRNRTNIFVLDACRNNPFKGFRSLSRGLTMMDAPVGTFIAYATAPGSVAADGTDRNSPYAKHLMEALRGKGVPIEKVFKQVLREVRKETQGQQVPWTASSLQDDFYFNPSHEASFPVTEPSGVTASPGSELPDYKTQLEKKKRESEQEIARLREAERVAALEKEKLERQRLEREVREREQELAKLREAQRLAALEKERLEREKQEMRRKIGSQKQQEEQRVASRPASIPTKPSTSEELGVAKLQRLADQGDARAQYDLGMIYYSGLGVPPDWQHAKKWLTKAANQGNVAVQTMLGVMYGEANDYTLALEWYRKAASQGDAMAQNNLGTMYLHGQGVSKDEAEAQKWFRKAGTRK